MYRPTKALPGSYRLKMYFICGVGRKETEVIGNKQTYSLTHSLTHKHADTQLTQLCIY